MSDLVTKSWETFEKWLAKRASDAFNPGATEEEIAAAEKFFNTTFSNSLKSLYRRHNGSKTGYKLFEERQFLNLEGAQAAWRELNELREKGIKFLPKYIKVFKPFQRMFVSGNFDEYPELEINKSIDIESYAAAKIASRWHPDLIPFAQDGYKYFFIDNLYDIAYYADFTKPVSVFSLNEFERWFSYYMFRARRGELTWNADKKTLKTCSDLDLWHISYEKSKKQGIQSESFTANKQQKLIRGNACAKVLANFGCLSLKKLSKVVRSTATWCL